MRQSIPLLAAALLWVGQASAQQVQVFAKRITTKFGAIEIEHEEGDKEHVAALTSLFEHLAENGLPPLPRPPLGFAQLQEKRAEILNQIATQLALPKPTPQLERVYDMGLKSFGEIREKLRIGMPSHYAIWRKDDLKARLRAGQKIEGHELDGDGAIFRLNLDFRASLDKPRQQVIAEIDATWAKVVWPVFVGEKSPREDVKTSIQDLFQVKSSIGTIEAKGVLAVLHASVGAAIEDAWFASTDTRWFQEGVTTWLTLEIVADRVSANDARRYYDPLAVLRRAPSATGTNLEKWVVADAERSRHSAAFDDGNQARAMLVIRAIVAAKGEDIIPKLLAELGQQKQRDLPAVYAAFRKLTGEDMRSYFAKVSGNET